jgi:hypothetical protein
MEKIGNKDSHQGLTAAAVVEQTEIAKMEIHGHYSLLA